MQSYLDSLILLGVPAALIIPLAVQGMKGLGMPVKFAPWASLGWGLVVMVMIHVVKTYPDYTWLVTIILGTLLLGFGGSGLYDAGRALKTALLGQPMPSTDPPAK